jgi:crotonobetainyl-CoA:carnitine CoA-transferase CaiB-like acyl-CoA transferase
MAWSAEAGQDRDLHVPGYTLPLTGGWHCYHLYRTADGGYVAFAPLEARHWRRFCDELGKKAWRARQYEAGPAMRRELEALFAARTRGEWSELFVRLDFPGEPVLSAVEALEHPQAIERGVVREDADGFLRFDYPALFDGARPALAPGSRVPALGAQTADALAAAGYAGGIAGRAAERRGVGRRSGFWRALWGLLKR